MDWNNCFAKLTVPVQRHRKQCTYIYEARPRLGSAARVMITFALSIDYYTPRRGKGGRRRAKGPTIHPNLPQLAPRNDLACPFRHALFFEPKRRRFRPRAPRCPNRTRGDRSLAVARPARGQMRFLKDLQQVPPLSLSAHGVFLSHPIPPPPSCCATPPPPPLSLAFSFACKLGAGGEGFSLRGMAVLQRSINGFAVLRVIL